MIEIPLQLNQGYKTLSVTSEEDIRALKNYHPNQVLKAKLWGIKKPRSYQQLKLYWACCKTVAENLEDKTKEDIDFEVKIILRHVKAFRVLSGGTTLIEVDSISFANLPHLEACNFFDRAFPVMAKMIGVTTDELLCNADT